MLLLREVTASPLRAGLTRASSSFDFEDLSPKNNHMDLGTTKNTTKNLLCGHLVHSCPGILRPVSKTLLHLLRPSPSTGFSCCYACEPRNASRSNSIDAAEAVPCHSCKAPTRKRSQTINERILQGSCLTPSVLVQGRAPPRTQGPGHVPFGNTGVQAGGPEQCTQHKPKRRTCFPWLHLFLAALLGNPNKPKKARDLKLQ